MKLTKEMKEKFVASVIAAIPRKHEMTRGLLVAELEKRHNAALPADVRAFAKKYPETVSLARSHPGADDDIIKHELSERIHGSGVRDPDLGDGSSFGRISVWYQHVKHEGTVINSHDLVEKFKAHLDERLVLDDLRREMLDKCEPCTTLAKLQDKFPELVEHMPKEAKTAVLVITPDKAFVNKLVKAGYPKKVAA